MSFSFLNKKLFNDKMEALAETKLLDFNLDKSCFVVMGSNGMVSIGITRIESFTKHQWKTLVNRKIYDMNNDNLLSQIIPSKNLIISNLKMKAANAKHIYPN